MGHISPRRPIEVPYDIRATGINNNKRRASRAGYNKAQICSIFLISEEERRSRYGAMGVEC